MKAIIIEESRFQEIFDLWLRETKEAARQATEDTNWPRFLQYHACGLKKRIEEAR